MINIHSIQLLSKLVCFPLFQNAKVVNTCVCTQYKFIKQIKNSLIELNITIVTDQMTSYSQKIITLNDVTNKNDSLQLF